MQEPNIDALLSRISPEQLDTWMAFYSFDPWGSQRDNYHTALICSLVANRTRGKNEHVSKFHDWLLCKEDKDVIVTPEELAAILGAEKS